MKDLLNKVAVISAPSLFEGQIEAQGFEYNVSGTQVRWRGQTEFVPIGSISVHKERSLEPTAEEKAKAVNTAKLKEAAERAQFQEQESARLREQILGEERAKFEAELRKRDAELQRLQGDLRTAEEKAKAALAPSTPPPSTPTNATPPTPTTTGGAPSNTAAGKAKS